MHSYKNKKKYDKIRYFYSTKSHSFSLFCTRWTCNFYDLVLVFIDVIYNSSLLVASNIVILSSWFCESEHWKVQIKIQIEYVILNQGKDHSKHREHAQITICTNIKSTLLNLVILKNLNVLSFFFSYNS